MTPEEQEVIDAAREWWKMQRPVSFTEDEHRTSPAINTHEPREQRLARAVAVLPRSKE